MPVQHEEFVAPDEHFDPDLEGGESIQEALHATSPGPESSSDVPPLMADTANEQIEVLPKFDPKHQLAFQGLLFIGALTDSFDFAGHSFTIRTLVTDELLEVALIHRRYQDSIGDIRAYTTAMVAACIETADGQRLPLPLEKGAGATEYRFNWISEHWYPAVIDKIYERYQLLEAKVDKVIEALGEASG